MDESADRRTEGGHATEAGQGERSDEPSVQDGSRGHEVDLPVVLTPKEAAGYLRVSVWAIYDAVNAGTLPAIRIGRSIRIPRRAVLAPGLADAETAVYLARLKGPLVLAFDPDDVGSLASDRLANHLWVHGRRPAVLAELDEDLGDSLVGAKDWPRKLAMHVRHAVASGPQDHPPTLEAPGL